MGLMCCAPDSRSFSAPQARQKGQASPDARPRTGKLVETLHHLDQRLAWKRRNSPLSMPSVVLWPWLSPAPTIAPWSAGTQKQSGDRQ